MKPEIEVIDPDQTPTGPTYRFTMDRREFFRVLGSGLAVTFVVASGFGEGTKLPEDQVGAWIHIGEDSKVTIYTGKAEVGQNIRTSLAQIVAEELNIDIDSVEMILGDTELTPFDMGTFGSRSIPYMGPTLRKAAATARDLLIDMAAQEWKVNDKTDLFLDRGQVRRHTTTQAISLGHLTKGKELMAPVNEKVSVKPVNEWHIAGTSVPKVNGAAYITGRHKYVSDMKLPGMLYGKVLRAPAFGSILGSVDLSAAVAMKEVIAVHDGDFVGVAAPDPRTAANALAAIKVEWKTTAQPAREGIFDFLRKNTEGAPRDTDPLGDAATALVSAAIKLEQTFHVDYIAHAPLEPRAGMAQWNGGKVTVWTGTQRPFGVQEDISKAFQIPKEDVRVIMPDTGSGYGGKHSGEAGIEAARLAKAAKAPVKLVWTREEEFTWAYFRPAGVIDVKAGIDSRGKLVSWEFHNYNSGPSGIRTPYDTPNKKIQYHPVRSPLRQGSYRGLAATANTFVRESVIDDLAEKAAVDPLTFRLNNLSNERMIGVLNAAATAFGWGKTKAAPGHGYGIACGEEKASYVATATEVAVDPTTRQVKVTRVVVSFECGAIINPEHLKNQIQGSVIQGLGGALFERIDFRDGKILNPVFSKYRVPRFSDIPVLEVVMVNRMDIPSAGAGETPILAIAPAIRNAIAKATGKKLYTLPLAPDGV